MVASFLQLLEGLKLDHHALSINKIKPLNYLIPKLSLFKRLMSRLNLLSIPKNRNVNPNYDGDPAELIINTSWIRWRQQQLAKR